MTRSRKRKVLLLAVLLYFMLATFVGMILNMWLRSLLILSGPVCIFGYMIWSIRDSKKQDWLPSDPPLGRGPDPFLSARMTSATRLRNKG